MIVLSPKIRETYFTRETYFRVAPTFDLEFALFITAGPSRYVCVLCGANSGLASMAARTQSTTLRRPSERERDHQQMPVVEAKETDYRGKRDLL